MIEVTDLKTVPFIGKSTIYILEARVACKGMYRHHHGAVDSNVPIDYVSFPEDVHRGSEAARDLASKTRAVRNGYRSAPVFPWLMTVIPFAGRKYYLRGATASHPCLCVLRIFEQNARSRGDVANVLLQILIATQAQSLWRYCVRGVPQFEF